MSIQYSYNGWGPSPNLESQIVKFEQFTIEHSTKPLIGTVLGIAKVALGLIQVFFGILIMLAMALPSVASAKAQVTFCRGFSHVVNGGANTISGTLETTWIGAHFLLAVRNLHYKKETLYCGSSKMEIPFQQELIVAYGCLDGVSRGCYLYKTDVHPHNSRNKVVCTPQTYDRPEKLTRKARWYGKPFIAI